ncbi:MAG TPA: type II toxin-antitoxin system VapC family toxin [Xanthobacteraceae bacterium]
MKYLLDTNIISELRKRERCNANVARWYSAVGEDDAFLSVLVLGEIRRGIEQIRRDAAQARALDRWLGELKEVFSDRVLSVDQSIAEEWGRMTALHPASAVDGLLAATARVHGMTLVTRNVAHVRNLGAQILNPFEPKLS